MDFCVKNLEEKFREQYWERLETVEGSIGVLKELIDENMKKKKTKVELDRDEYVLTNTNFESIYEDILNLVFSEEIRVGFSQYRAMLDKIDEKLDKLTADDRKDIRRMEEGVARESVGPHNINKDYAKPVFHISAYSIDLMGVA